jgi:Fe-Mn family superoxide dismutase
MVEQTLSKLPYAYNALEPVIDEQTVMIHHDKHHQTYLDKLNAAVKGTKFERMDVNDILKDLAAVPENIRNAVKNHGGGYANHNLYWAILGGKGGMPKGKLMDAITSVFGSFDKFKETLTNTSVNHFGSGWGWLVVDNKTKKLEVMSTPNQDSPLSIGKTPIMTIDIWEHAYYLKYQNKRADHVNAIWNVFNWTEIEKRYLAAVK